VAIAIVPGSPLSDGSGSPSEEDVDGRGPGRMCRRRAPAVVTAAKMPSRPGSLAWGWAKGEAVKSAGKKKEHFPLSQAKMHSNQSLS
jgi:hypothetical protein